jgi:hypothetical protein
MTLVRRGSAKKKHEARRAWLTPALDRYAGVPGIHDDVTDANRAALDALCDVMNTSHLLGSSTRAIQRETVRRLLSELRGEDVKVGW